MALDSFLNLAEKLFSTALLRVKDPLERKRVSIAFNLALAQIGIYVGLFLFATLNGSNSETTYYTLISTATTILMILLTHKGYPKFAMAFGLVLSYVFMIFIVKRAGTASGVDLYYAMLGLVPFVFSVLKIDCYQSGCLLLPAFAFWRPAFCHSISLSLWYSLHSKLRPSSLSM